MPQPTYYLFALVFGIAAIVGPIVNALIWWRSEARLLKAIAELSKWISDNYVDKQLCTSHHETVRVEVEALRVLVAGKRA